MLLYEEKTQKLYFTKQMIKSSIAVNIIVIMIKAGMEVGQV